MAELENVRIDGNPILAGPSDVLPKGFVISWGANGGYQGYQIKIGSSNAAWGSDGFSGNIASVAQPTLPSAEHAFNFAGGLVRAQVFYGQIKLLPTGSWLKFTIRIKTVPQIVDAFYSENSLGINTILSIEVNSSPPNAEYRIEWYGNGTRIFAIDNSPNLPSSYLRFGDEWFARIIPFDSLESGAPMVLPTLTVEAVSSFSSDVTIHPANPTPDDILYASYDASAFADVNENAVSYIHRWFVNGGIVLPSLGEADTDGGRWARLRVVPGDEVYVQVQSFVAGAQGQSSISDSVSIGASSRSFSPVLVDGRSSDSTSTSLSPTITWRYPDADDLNMQIKIGSLPGDGSYLNYAVPASSGIATVPEGVLLPGLTYYVTLSIDESESISDVIRFSTPGNPWLSSASNSDGWRLQFGMSCVKNSDSGPTVLYPYSLDAADDRLVISLDISPSTLRLRSGSNIVYTGVFDMTVEKQVGLSCVGSNVAVHVNSVQVFSSSISGQEIFSASKYVQISPRSRDSTSYDLTISSVSFAKSFSPAQAIGAYPLGSLPCSFVSHISQSSGGFSVIGSDGPASSDTVYFVSPSVSPRVYDCSVIGQSGSGISLISGDSYGQHVMVAHPFGATVISGSAVDEWNLSCDFHNKSSLEASGFSSVSSHGTDPFVYQGDYLDIDTTFSKVGVPATKASSGLLNVAKIETRLGIAVYEFTLSSGVLYAALADSELDDIFKQSFYISFIDSDVASVIQKLNQVNISANTDVIPFSLYYNTSVTSGYEGVDASLISDFNSTESSPLLLQVQSDAIFAGVAPMESASGRKAYIETMRGSTIWSQYALDESGYTMELSFAYDKIEESLASDSVDEGGIGLSWFDGNTKHNINIETEKVLLDGNQVALSEAGQQIDVLISKNSKGTSAFMKLGGSVEWNGPFEASGSISDMVSGTCFDPKIACSSDGASMVAVWWSDDGSNQPVSWMSWWSQDLGWSLPTRMYGDMSSSRPDIVWSDSLDAYQVCLTSLDGSSAAIMHSAISISGKSPKIQPYSRVALTRSATCSGQVSIDGVDSVHVVWNDNVSGHDELYHAYLPEFGGWSSGGSDGYKVTSTLGGAKNHKIVYSSNNLFVVFESLDGVGGSKIAMARYLVSNSRWESSGAGLVDTQLSSAMDSFASSRPSIASSQDGNCHVCWDDFIRTGTVVTSSRAILYRSFNPTLVTLSNIAIVAFDYARDCTHASVSCPTDPAQVALAYLKRSNPVPGVSGVRYEQLGNVPTIHLILRGATSVSASGWPNINLHKPVVASTARIVSSVSLASSTFKNLHFVYGFSSISAQDRSQREFLNNDTAAYGRVSFESFSPPLLLNSYLELGSASESTDDVRLVRVNEPYIRFGDMSSFRSAKLVLYKLRVFVGGGYAPRQITFIGSAARPLPAKYPSDVDIGASGDAFIVSDGHVFHYDWQSESLFDMSSETAMAITHLPAPAAEAQYCYFDSDGNMLVLTQAGDVYVSYDLFRFVQFDFGAPVVKVVKSDGLYIVKSSKLFYIKNWNRYVSQIPSSQPSSAITVAEDDMEEICDFNGGDVAHSNILGVCLIGQFGVRRIVEGLPIDVGSSGSFGSQRVVSLVDGYDGNVYCATGSRVFRLDGSRWTPLLVASSSGSRTNLGQIFSISKLADKLMVACEYGVFESRPSGSYMVGSMIANSLLYLVPPSGSVDTTSYEFSMPAGEGIDSDSVLQASINGRLVNVGFGVSKEDAGRRVVRFACPLLAEDNVSLVVRDDLQLIRKLNPNRAEVASGFSSTRRLNHVIDGGLEFFAVADAGERSVVKLSSSSGLPSDEVVLDTEPPQGKLNFVSQISVNSVRLSVDPIRGEDGPLPYDATSGVSTYEVSNFSNFTTDGVTPVEPQPFTTQFEHNLLNLSSLSGLIWNETNGKISGFVSFRPVGALSAKDFIFTSLPAACRFKTGDNFSDIQTMIGTDPVNSRIAGVIVFRNELHVAVVKDEVMVAIYKSSDGAQFSLVSPLDAEGFAGFFLSDYDNSLYMLTDSPARIYQYTGSGTPSARVNFVAETGSGISGFDRFVVVATGQDKRIYRADLGSVPIVVESLHYDSDALTTVASLGANIYVGTASDGRIMRSVDEDEPFLASFRSTAAPILAVNKIVLAGRDNIFASVGRQIYRYANGWVVVGQSNANIVGIGQSTDNQVVFWTESSLYAVNVSGAVRRVYLRLTDKAGNSTALASEPDENGDGINDNLVFDISSNLLRSSALSGQIIEFEADGTQTVLIGNGDAPFFSADRVRRESATIETNILNASDGHVAWGKMSWVSETPQYSEIWIYFKVGRTRDQCASAEYSTPISSVVQEFDMSGQVGQFIQIKIVLMSTSSASNPIMQQISIESLTSSTSQFITTTFVLPSPVKRGILSMDKLIPVSAMIVPCLDTLDRVSIADFQELPENRLFSVDGSQYGTKLRVGFKFLTPAAGTDGAPSENYGDIYRNAVLWNIDNSGSSTDDVVDFTVYFYDDEERTSLRASANTVGSPQYFLFDGLPFPNANGATILAGRVGSFAMLPYAFSLVSGVTYYVDVSATRNGVEEGLPELSRPFIKEASVSMYNIIVFEFLPGAGLSDTYDFRIRMYEDEALTQMASSYFSLANSSGWTAGDDDEPWSPTTPPFFGDQDPTRVTFTPPPGDLEVNKRYFITIESFNGSNFSLNFVGLSFIKIIETGFDCGDQVNVPILKGFSMMFELEDGSLVKFNSLTR